MRKSIRKPVIGSHFDVCRMGMEDRPISYAETLEHYRPRGFSKLARELRVCANRFKRSEDDALDIFVSLADEADALLTEWARRVTRNDYIAFGPFPDSGDVGFYIDVENAQSDADLTVSDTSDVPTGFSGMVVHVNDHGNVSAYRYSRGKARELFSVV